MIRKYVLKEIIRDFHMRELPEVIERDVKVSAGSGKVISIVGVRRSGKTYLMFHTIRKLLESGEPVERMIYVNFEDERLEFKREELDLIIQAYRELYPDQNLKDCFFFFDEVQNVEGWERFVRRVYDSISKNVFITGSNSRLLSTEIATSLRGRTVKVETFPLSFGEFLRFKGFEFFPSKDVYSSSRRAKLVNLFEEYVTFGGFPEVVLSEERDFKLRILQEYFDVMLYRDLVERYNISNPYVLKFFIKRVFESTGKPLSVNRIFNQLKSGGYRIGKDTLYQYLDYATAVYLVRVLQKYSKSVLKRELGEKKVYAVDNGLLMALSFEMGRDYGRLLENAVFNELLRQGGELFFYKNRKECDFVWFVEGQPVLIQVSYELRDKRTSEREIAGFMDVCRFFGKKEGYILTAGTEEEHIEDGIHINVLPAWKFLLTLPATFS